MASYQMLLYGKNSVSQYSETDFLSSPANSFFPGGSVGDVDADGATVRFGNLNGQLISVNDDDPLFQDGDVSLFGGQSSNSSTSLFNLDGGIEPEYAYTLTDPGTGESFRIYAVTATDLLIGNTIVGFVSEQKIDPAVSYNVSYDAPPFLGSTADSAPTVAYSNLVCFVRGSLIETERGPVAVEDLAVGDPVLTCDHGHQPVRWIGRRRLSGADLAAAPHLRPIRIRAHSLGDNIPQRDLAVSPQHRMLVNSVIVQRMFAADEVLVAAKHLLALDGIEIVEDAAEVEYFHILFDRHEIIYGNGAPTESLYAGPMALKGLGPEARAEVMELFPELADMTHPPRPSRPFASGRKGFQLALRHRCNRKPAVTTCPMARHLAAVTPPVVHPAP
ncbi:Hint domain-containing protein [Anianabacter salinae]|uniref:Hint domain-containing protein n=1 Tax=Anianabacter salinae TaxID=2851023 RepID=UPI00225DDEA4|nr:Hint domain-containing protein [Anianabacter salinae]MBV0911108.1 Hint domain-containing protein [Anianabacter salinae]